MTTDEHTELSNEELAQELKERVEALEDAARDVDRALLDERAALTDETTGTLWERCEDVEALCRRALASRTVQRVE